MVQSHSQFALSWTEYQGSICKGFASLQQNGEFVDMTLAADGHVVKVHQMLIALSSPYLKEMINGAACPHPVIFLNNVSHPILCNLLEYIYTGKVYLPQEDLPYFLEAAKALQITGLNNLVYDECLDLPPMEKISGAPGNVTGTKRINIPSGDTVENISLPTSAKNIKVKNESYSPIPAKKGRRDVEESESHVMDDDVDIHYDDDDHHDDYDSSSNKQPTTTPQPANLNPSIQYTVSNRGCLQMILNRYMYNLFSTAQLTGIRRWRCVDYSLREKDKRCSAFIVTNGNVILSRANLHNHSFHDKKILSKTEKQIVYSAIDEVKGYKQRGHETTLKKTKSQKNAEPSSNKETDDEETTSKTPGRDITPLRIPTNRNS